MGWFRSTPDDEGMPTLEDRLAAITPGVPGRCPACDGLGYIDTIDLAHRYQIQHCKDCLHRWEYLFDEDGAVVGLTELDETGQPVARTRVRPLRAATAEAGTAAPAAEPEIEADIDPEPAPEPEQDIQPEPEPELEAVAAADTQPVAQTAVVVEPEATAPSDDVLDLRDSADAPDAPVEHMSAAEWLRHSIRR